MSNNSDLDFSGSKPRRSLGSSFLFLGLVALLAILYLPSPYVIKQPGPTYNVLGTHSDKPVISISEAKTYPTTGNFDILSVSVVGSRENPPNWFQILGAWLDSDTSVTPIDEVFPPGQTYEESTAESTAMMEQSQQDAIAVALKALGYEIPVQVYVSQVDKDSASSGKIVAADFVKKVNGVPISTIEDLREQVNTYDGKVPITIELNRDGEKKSVKITPIKDETDSYRLGILVGYKYDFPIKVDLQLADVGGPSGGMMFALGIYDKLTPGELTAGNHIAGTGGVDQNGLILPMGGIQYKMIAAKKAGAKYFFASEANCNEVVEHAQVGLQVIKVTDFKDALESLEKIGKGKDIASLPTCTTK